MNEDTTQNLSGARSFEERVLAEFAAQREANMQQREMNAQMLDAIMQLGSRIGALEARTNARFDALETHLTELETRLIALEDRVDARLHETRPIWEGVHARLKEIEHTLGAMNYHMKSLVNDSFKLRARVEKLEDEKFENSPL